MKISIVTISFNQRAYLQQAIESVLDQKYPELEYIVVDAGSSDGSRELIDSYSAKLSHVILEPDHGPPDGLNKGFSKASGEVFGFLNSDDLLMPGSLQRVADFFERHPSCELGFGNGFVIDGAGKRMRHVKARKFTLRRFLYRSVCFLQQATFFRRRAYQRTPGFNLGNRTCWDGELFANLVKQGATVGYIGADLAEFRIHSASISGSQRLQQIYAEDSRRIFRELKGREWTGSDQLLKWAYRTASFPARVGSRLDNFFLRGYR